MFVERLTDIQIQEFKINTPLYIKGKSVPYKIICKDRYFNDPKGNSPYAIFLRDFSCSLSYADSNTKDKLNKHYIKFMRSIFKEEYDEALSCYLYSNSNETTSTL